MHVLFVLALASPSLPLAGDTVRGRVTDSSDAAVVAAQVQLVELDRRTITDSAGRFAFVDVPAGAYTLVVRRVGLAPVIRRLAVSGTVDVELRAGSTPFDLDAVTVTATRRPEDPLESALAPASLGGARLARSSDISLAHAVTGLPGVRALTTGGEIGKPVIRGLTGARVLVLDNGHRLDDYSWSDEDGPSVDAALTQRIEVIRGPASVLYGSDALAGVINAVPADLPDAPPGTRVRHGSLDLFGASNNAEFGGLLRMEGASGGGLGWQVGVAGRRSEALHTPAGELENTGFAAFDGAGAIGTRGPWGRATLRAVHYGGEFHLLESDTAGAPPPPPPPGGEEEGPVRKLADDRVQFTGEFPWGGNRLEVKSQWQRHWLAETVEGDTSATAEPGFDLLLSTVSTDILWHHGGGASRASGTLGIAGSLQSNDSRGEAPIVPDANSSAGGAFALQQFTFGRFRLQGGVRIDLQRLSADSDSVLARGATTLNHSAWSGSAGLVFRASAPVAFVFNAGRSWRAPTLFELFSNGEHLGEARYEVGDPTLDPEAAVNIDVGVRWRGGRVRGEITGFSNWVDNYLYINPTGTFITPPGATDSLPVYDYVQSDAWLRGAEVMIEGELRPGFTLRGTLDHVLASRRGGKPLPLTPPLRGTVGAAWQTLRPSGARYGWRLETELVAKQTRLAPTDVPTAGYGLVHLGGDFEGRLAGRRLRVALEARNLLDKRYRDFLSRYKRFALNPGRNITLRVGTDL